MAIFRVEVTEYLQRIIEVEADTVEEAVSKVEDDYAQEKIVLNYDDCKEFEIKEYEED